MGCPPDPRSTRAPAGTMAVPGLIPDLFARIPWEFWDLRERRLRGALIAAAAVAGMLIVSCLLCAICCCHRGCHRKKPRDKETVGLGSAHGSTTTHLVQPDVGNMEPDTGGPRQWGRLQLSMEYDFGSQEIKVDLKQAADLRPRGPGGTADPYARVSLSPEAGCRHETKVHRGTLCPMFEETCFFQVSAPPAELPRTTLQVQVLYYRHFSQHELLGGLCLPLVPVDPRHLLELWHPLGPPDATAEPELTGELCFSLRYVPGSGHLTMVMLEARGLSPVLAELYVKVQLMLNQRKWKKRKTSARKGTATPYFNEAFTFLVPFSQIQVGCLEEGAGEVPRSGLNWLLSFSPPTAPLPASTQNVDLVLAVWAWGLQFRAEPVCKVLLGAWASGQPLQYWADMLVHAWRPVARWHRLQPAGEVDRALALQPRLHLPWPGS
ncbi:synaptotagmin-8 [Hippopotamus amphibius kiboko]|uniref:synaptotagmin-8 n=1 Tax=Hippopotamus amphibius kiboko TaxID=575201 RepID=UPI002596176F|nr:synaptotagmin-8 [Hippopotamus amphibius kiboko]